MSIRKIIHFLLFLATVWVVNTQAFVFSKSRTTHPVLALETDFSGQGTDDKVAPYRSSVPTQPMEYAATVSQPTAIPRHLKEETSDGRNSAEYYFENPSTFNYEWRSRRLLGVIGCSKLQSLMSNVSVPSSTMLESQEYQCVDSQILLATSNTSIGGSQIPDRPTLLVSIGATIRVSAQNVSLHHLTLAGDWRIDIDAAGSLLLDTLNIDARPHQRRG